MKHLLKKIFSFFIFLNIATGANAQPSGKPQDLALNEIVEDGRVLASYCESLGFESREFKDENILSNLSKVQKENGKISKDYLKPLLNLAISVEGFRIGNRFQHRASEFLFVALLNPSKRNETKSAFLKLQKERGRQISGQCADFSQSDIGSLFLHKVYLKCALCEYTEGLTPIIEGIENWYDATLIKMINVSE